MDKCAYCDAEAEFKCMVESDEHPGVRTETVDVCSEHMATVKVQKALIESWTKREWLEMD